MDEKFSDMTDQALIDLFKGCYDAIYNLECYGTSDLFNMRGAQIELENRGYHFVEHTTVEVVKDEKDEEEEIDENAT